MQSKLSFLLPEKDAMALQYTAQPGSLQSDCAEPIKALQGTRYDRYHLQYVVKYFALGDERSALMRLWK